MASFRIKSSIGKIILGGVAGLAVFTILDYFVDGEPWNVKQFLRDVIIVALMCSLIYFIGTANKKKA